MAVFGSEPAHHRTDVGDVIPGPPARQLDRLEVPFPADPFAERQAELVAAVAGAASVGRKHRLSELLVAVRWRALLARVTEPPVSP